MTKITSTSIALLACIFASGGIVNTAFASAEKGLEIAAEVDSRDKGFGDSISQLTMVLADKHGDKKMNRICYSKGGNNSWRTGRRRG